MANKTGTKTKYIIGIDSGATSSEVVIVRTPLSPLFSKRGRVSARGIIKKYPPINFNVLGFDESLKRLVHIIKESSKKTGLKNIAYVIAGISGARNEIDRKSLQKRVSAALGIKNISIYPDTAIAFASIFSHFDKNCGILLAGTGSVLYFVNRKGKVERYGGWGRTLGDEGSGYWIVKEALNRLTLSFDKRGRKTKLEKILKSKFGITRENLVDKIYHGNFDISKITRYVFRLAEEGDKISADIIKEAAVKLAVHFLPLGKVKATIALCGSLFMEEKLLEKHLKKIVKDKYPNITLIKPKRKPVWGAVDIGIALMR